MSAAWPYLTGDIPPLSAVFRARPEDFLVEEVPEYDPCGVGDHLYAWVEKRGISTRQMVRQLAAALGIPPERIGVAGQKDTHGIARQMVSLERVTPERLKAVSLSGVTVLDAARHRTKLRLGSLRGNRFVIRLREVGPGGAETVSAVLTLLTRLGVPNYFGPQRFGVRGDTWEVGRALLQGDPARARAIAARWPRTAGAVQMWQGLDRWLVGFAVSAYQGWLFNAVLAERLPGIDRVLPGDLAFVHATGGFVPIRGEEAEQSRAAQFLISATGPIVGHTMTEPSGDAGALERRVLTAEGIRSAELPRSGPLKCVGGRRPLRFRPSDGTMEPGQDDLGPFLEIRFALPRGCYATAVLREICKGALADRSDRSDRPGPEGPADPTAAGPHEDEAW